MNKSKTDRGTNCLATSDLGERLVQDNLSLVLWRFLVHAAPLLAKAVVGVALSNGLGSLWTLQYCLR